MPTTMPPIPTAPPAPPSTGRIAFDPAWCRTCRVCEVACAIAREGQARPAVARINVYYDEFREADPIWAVVCYQCADAPCLDACPVGAMSRHAATGAVLIDAESCIGCLQCANACPWGIPKLHPERGIAIKCDLCSDRGDGPMCVRLCPLKGKALRYLHDGA
ncbi:MAG: 4Fe-4S dicluster domain-containing protein [Chloroflexota bacterium]